MCPRRPWIRAAANCGSAALRKHWRCPPTTALVLAYRDTARGLEYLRRATDLHHHGFGMELRGYQYAVLLHWRELISTAEQPWCELCDALAGAGVPSVDEALARLRVRPVHEALRHAISAAAFALVKPAAPLTAVSEPGTVTGPTEDTVSPLPAKLTIPASAANTEPVPKIAAAPPEEDLAPFLEAAQAFQQRVFEKLPSTAHSQASSAEVDPRPGDAHSSKATASLEQLARRALAVPASAAVPEPPLLAGVQAASGAATPGDEAASLPLFAYLVIQSLEPTRDSRKAYDDLLLRSALAEAFSEHGLHGEPAWRAAAKVRVLLSTEDDSGKDATQSPEFWADPDVRWMCGVHESEGKSYFNREGFISLLQWLSLRDLLSETKDARERELAFEQACAAAEHAGYEVHRYLQEVSREPSIVSEDEEQQISEEPLALPEPLQGEAEIVQEEALQAGSAYRAGEGVSPGLPVHQNKKP